MGAVGPWTERPVQHLRMESMMEKRHSGSPM